MKENQPDKSCIVIYFPVQAHVYKYLQAKVGESLKVSRKDFWGNLILDMLSKRYTPNHEMNSELVFPVEISMRYMSEYGVFFDSRIVKKFNSQVDKMMREEMRTHVFICNEKNGVPKDRALKQFMDFFNIVEDDIKFETLKKDLVRSQKGTN
jgi:hypothetical protein